MTSRYLIIHGHFYQPPRENPWILAIEDQKSAAPYANWNQRINRECYAPNSRSRLLDREGSIYKLINNYEYLSFNFGPTLLSWLEKADPSSYKKIIQADQKAAAANNGHGSALAQVYNHIIMPLANTRDKVTQIRWGIKDFQSRFERFPEGMWLAETAVDLESLKIMASEGLKFTVLSQNQAAAVRDLGDGNKNWKNVSNGQVDPREPYRVFWGQGKNDYLDVFFYDGAVSRAIAFENLLKDGAQFLRRIEEAFGAPWASKRPRLVNLATDGESYGHHFSFGDMALAWLFNHLEESRNENEAIKLSNYGHFLSIFPPDKEAQIFDNSSWSCVHGVERWRSNCGCNTGGGYGKWNQKWRAPLRDGLDKLRDKLAEILEEEAGKLLKDPWAARNAFINVISNYYDNAAVDIFLKEHQKNELNEVEKATVLRLMEAQLMALYMFTSCAWFFDDISGLEPVQNLRYALRAIELSQKYCQADLSDLLMSFLKTIQPNNTEYEDGEKIWKDLIEPDSLSENLLTAHWAASKFFDAPKVENFINFPKFKAEKIIRLSGQNIQIFAAAVDLLDARLEEKIPFNCLGVYSSSSHLAILVEPRPLNNKTLPDWLDEEKLLNDLGGKLEASATLSIWEQMLKLMPNSQRFILEDFLGHCRSLLISSMINDVYDDLKGKAREVFHLNQDLLLLNRSAGKHLSWEERFIFRAMGESELKRILSPAEKGQAINLTALNSLFRKNGLLKLAQEEELIAGFGAEIFLKIFSGLAESRNPGRILTGIIEFFTLVKSQGFKVDLWALQNLWLDLTYLENMLNRLNKDEKNQMVNLGLALGFAPAFIETIKNLES